MMWLNIKASFFIVGAILLQTQIFLGDSVDWLAMFSFFMVLRLGLMRALVLSFLGGLVWDSLSGNYLSVKSLCLSISCMFVSGVVSVINHEHVMTRTFLIFLGTVLMVIVESLLTTLLSDRLSISMGHFLRMGLYTSLTSIGVYPLFRRMMRRRDIYGYWMAA